jgi:hypothetical protein
MGAIAGSVAPTVDVMQLAMMTMNVVCDSKLGRIEKRRRRYGS